MTPERDERYEALKKRRAEREAQRQKERRQLFVKLSLVVTAVLMVAALISAVNRNSGSAPNNGETTLQTEQTTPSVTQTPENTEGSGGTTVIRITAAGDLNVTDATVENNLRDGTYDFTDAFLDVAPVLSNADLTLLDLEGNFSGSPYGSENGSAPLQLADALSQLGVDAVQTANSSSIRAGILGLRSTLTTLKDAGITAVGTFADSEAFQSSGGYTILDVKGVKIALVAFTKGMDNMGLPEGSGNCVNVLYEDYQESYDTVDADGINAVLEKIQAQEPDLTIAMLHWGSEHNEEISSSQKKIKTIMLQGGVDVILGTHSHLLQKIEYDEEASTLVAYSLGDFYGDAAAAGTNYSVILNLEITRDDVTGETKITDWGYTPIYIVKPEQSTSGGLRVVRIGEAMARFESGYIGAVSQSVYDSMEYTLGRIEERIHGEEK